MKELKKGDFTGIYSSIDGKPLYFTGVYSCMEYDGMPCVFLATDLHNNLTFCRWSQQDLNKRGFTIPPEPVRISKTAMQMIQKAGAVIRWTTAAERKAANTDHKRMSAYIITTAAGDFYTTGTCADVREILKAAQAAPLPEESTPATEANQDTTTGAQDGPTVPESNTAGENTTGADNATEEAPTSAGTNADTETPTQGETAPQAATSEATTAQNNTSSTDTQNGPTTAATVPGEQDNTGSDTTPPHHPATLAKSPQDARNEHSPDKYTPRTPNGHHGPRRTQPPTAGPGATPKKPRILADFHLYWTFPERFSQIFRVYPFRYVFSGRFLIRNFGAQNRTPWGVSKSLADPRRKNFQKNYEGGTMGTKQQRRLDISGMKQGKLTAIKKTGYGVDKDGKRYALWLCKCDCGGEKNCAKVSHIRVNT